MRLGLKTSHATAIAMATAGLTPPSNIAADCSTDVTTAMQAWVDSVPDGSLLRFPAGSCYLIEGGLEMTGREGLTFSGGGATMRATTIDDGHRSNLRFTDCVGITVEGLRLEGGYTDPGVHDPLNQHGHGVDLLGSEDVLVEDVTIVDVCGDGVYAGLGTARSQDVTVRNVTVDGTGRNGVSAVAVDNLLVTGGTYDVIGYIAFDVEPNALPGFGVDGATFTGATVGDYFLNVGTIVGDAQGDNILFEDLNIVAAKGARLQIGATNGRRRANVSYVNNFAVNVSTTGSAYAILADSVDGLTVTGNVLPLSSGVLLSCASITALTFSGNTPNTKSGC